MGGMGVRTSVGEEGSTSYQSTYTSFPLRCGHLDKDGRCMTIEDERRVSSHVVTE
jgi:hypothetical protein